MKEDRHFHHLGCRRLPQAREDPVGELECLVAYCDGNGPVKHLVETWLQRHLVEVVAGNLGCYLVAR